MFFFIICSSGFQGLRGPQGVAGPQGPAGRNVSPKNKWMNKSFDVHVLLLTANHITGSDLLDWLKVTFFMKETLLFETLFHNYIQKCIIVSFYFLLSYFLPLLQMQGLPGRPGEKGSPGEPVSTESGGEQQELSVLRCNEL